MANLFTPEIKVDPEAQSLVRAWIDALRSDNYEQGDAFLRKDDKYCCLGVLCELAPDVERTYDAHSNHYLYDNQQSVLPQRVYDLVHLTSDLGSYDFGRGVDSLTSLNDTGQSFQRIADLIERELKEALA